ncbi:unnamed protein product [Ectocarpus sp. 12 AP-2014]
MALRRTATATATATAGVLATVITAARPALPTDRPTDRSKNTVDYTCTTDPATTTADPATTTAEPVTTTTTTTGVARAKEKKKWRSCMLGRVALPTEFTPPRTYAHNTAVLVPTGCPCTTAKCTPSAEVEASTARAYTAAGMNESVMLECTRAQVTAAPTLVATRNTTACTTWTATETPPVRTWTMAPFLTGQDGTTTAAPSVYTSDCTAPARPACRAERGARTSVTTSTPGRSAISTISSTSSTCSSTEGWRRAPLAFTPVMSAPLPRR